MCEDGCRSQLQIVHSWLSDDQYESAKWLVRDYIGGFGRACFDTLASQTPANAIAEGDLNAVRALSVRFPRTFVQPLEREDVQHHVREILIQIPADAILEDLSCPDFDRLLGPDSVAWRAWQELSDCLRTARARAPLAGASKLLAAKECG